MASKKKQVMKLWLVEVKSLLGRNRVRTGVVMLMCSSSSLAPDMYIKSFEKASTMAISYGSDDVLVHAYSPAHSN